MKRNRTIIEVFATLLLTALMTDTAIPVSAAATKPKSAGRTSNAAPNTILNGKGVPLSTQGIDGDFYIDTRSLLIYGPKKTGKWPLPQSLQGPAGIPGVDGKNGSEGKIISNASNVAGPSGAQGLQGEKGDKGEPGLPGGNGAPGPAGAKGETGAAGPQGATGPSGGGGGGTTGPAGPTGATGAKGDTGATGAAGAAGAQGPIGLTGPKGETGTAGSNGTNGAVGATGATGAVGATGPSNVYRGTFAFPDISGGAGTSQTTSLSGFKSGSSYLVEVAIIVYQPTRNIDNSLPLGVAITNNVGTASIWYKYQTSKGRSYRSGAASERYEYTAMVQIVLDGTSSVDYSINLQLSVGIDTTTYLARSDATFTATLVGAVGTL
ncbi:hypothetical protein MCEGKSE7_01008 [Candidatus Nanopelagicaceae bacterium]